SEAFLTRHHDIAAAEMALDATNTTRIDGTPAGSARGVVRPAAGTASSPSNQSLSSADLIRVPGTTPSEPPPRRRSPWRIPAYTAAVFGLLVGGAFVLRRHPWSGGHPAPTPSPLAAH